MDIDKALESALQKISEIHKSIQIDKYVIMPNHLHMILILRQAYSDGSAICSPATVSTIINQFKGYVTKQLGFSLWQRSFHDRIIRNEDEYNQVRRYIDENPIRWNEDEYYA